MACSRVGGGAWWGRLSGPCLQGRTFEDAKQPACPLPTQLCSQLVAPALFPPTPLGQVLFDGPGTLVVDSVSLFPAAAVEKGAALGLLNPWPFRADLLSALKVLQPRWVGCTCVPLCTCCGVVV